MMRAIEAEERLAAIVDGSLATGNMERHHANRHRSKLEAAMRGGVRSRAARATPATIAAMGITVITPLSKPAEKAPSDG